MFEKKLIKFVNYYVRQYGWIDELSETRRN